MKSKKISLELLAPAGNADIGIAAIDHGADAVYIGAPQFSARADAGAAFAEIGRLIRHARVYYAKVYVALNTILADQEIPIASAAIYKVHDLEADGLIIQDVGLLETDLPPIPLIASTQMHNHTPEKIRFLEQVGFKRAILARELALDEIASIRKNTGMELECFVHGALCVCYSGQCYMSQAVAGRSGNRGICAQPCRSRYTLTDGDGNKMLSDKFLLSLKDLNRMHCLPELIEVGVTSFKIEGRYKGIDYVKNVTAAYSRALDDFIDSHPDYVRSSSGRCEPAFSPDPALTFNRGFTEYFMHGRKGKIASMDTPKSIGRRVGTITKIGKGFFQTDGAELQNGDGLCFFTGEKALAGFRVERVEGPKVFPSSMKGLSEGMVLYRNRSIAFDRLLQKSAGRRRIDIEIDFIQDGAAVHLTALDADGNKAEISGEAPFAEPRDPAMAKKQVKKQIFSTGNTPFRVSRINVSSRVGFFSISYLNNIRRRVIEELLKVRNEKRPRASRALVPNSVPYPIKRLDYRANVLNQYARRFYERHGAEIAEPAFEILSEMAGKEVMRTKYCLRYELDACLKSDDPARLFKEPLYLHDRHHRYLLKFDCKACTMSIIFLGKR